MPAPQDFALDHALVRRRFAAAAPRYAGADVLARELARRMDERLAYIRITHPASSIWAAGRAPTSRCSPRAIRRPH